MLVWNNTKCRFGDIATQARGSVTAGAQSLWMIRWLITLDFATKCPAVCYTYSCPLTRNAINQLPVKSPSFTLKVSQEVIFSCPTAFRASPEEQASIFAKLILQALFYQDRLIKEISIAHKLRSEHSVGHDVICCPVFNLILKWLRFYAKLVQSRSLLYSVLGQW